MPRPLVTAVSLLLLTVALHASSIESAIVAAMQLSAAANYSWHCTVTDDAGTYKIEGKTEHTGFTWQRQPMPKLIARRLGRGASYDLEAFFHGPQAYVILTENGWQKLEELPKRHPDWTDQNEFIYATVPALRSADMPADEQATDPLGLPQHAYILLPQSEKESDRVYSNAQFALALPHEQLGVIVSSYDELAVNNNIATGTLSDLGARLLLVHDGHEYIRPVTAGGRFKLWLTPQRVEKFSVDLAGVVLVGRRAIYVRQTSTTEIKAVGSTTVNVPAEARRRL